MLEKINNSKTMTLIAIMLIALIPIGLLISSGVSEFLTILLVLFYSFYFIIHKDYSIIKSIYFPFYINKKEKKNILKNI